MEQTIFYAIQQRPLSTGEMSVTGKLVQAAQQAIRQSPAFYSLLYKEAGYIELNSRFFHNAKELNTLKENGNTDKYIKTSKIITPLFIQAIDSQYCYLIGHSRPKGAHLVGYFVSVEPIDYTIVKKLPLPNIISI